VLHANAGEPAYALLPTWPHVPSLDQPYGDLRVEVRRPQQAADILLRTVHDRFDPPFKLGDQQFVRHGLGPVRSCPAFLESSAPDLSPSRPERWSATPPDGA
jgi:hypothetical protein